MRILWLTLLISCAIGSSAWAQGHGSPVFDQIQSGVSTAGGLMGNGSVNASQYYKLGQPWGGNITGTGINTYSVPAATGTTGGIINFGPSEIVDNSFGVVIGSPQGGAQGNGTLNVSGLYVNGVNIQSGLGATGLVPGSVPAATSSNHLAPSSIFDNAGGVTIGSPTGGAKGAGSLNVPTLYINGTLAGPGGGNVVGPSGNVTAGNYATFAGGTGVQIQDSGIGSSTNSKFIFHGSTTDLIQNLGTISNIIDNESGTVSGNIIASPKVYLADNGTSSYIQFQTSGDARSTLGDNPNGDLVLGSQSVANTSPVILFYSSHRGAANPDAEIEVSGTNTMYVAAGGNSDIVLTGVRSDYYGDIYLHNDGQTSGVLLPGTVTAPSVNCLGLLASYQIVGTGSPCLSTGTNNNFTGNQYFGSGLPWCDVRSKGAVGDGSTDDSAAFQSCVNQVQSGGVGGIVFVSSIGSTFCVRNVVVSNSGVRIIGSGSYSTFISVCGANLPAFQLTQYRDSLENMYVEGTNAIGASYPAVWLRTNCVECALRDVVVLFGNGNILSNDNATDMQFTDIRTDFSYGVGAVEISGNAYTNAWIKRGKLDSEWPTNVYPPVGQNPNNWSANTGVSANQVVFTQGWVIQYSAGGTTGSSPPALCCYGQAIHDGSATAYLVSLQTSASVYCNSCYETHLDQVDMTVAYAYGAWITGAYGGEMSCNGCVIAARNTGARLDQGLGGFHASNTEFGACRDAGCNLILGSSGWAGNVTVTNSDFQSGCEPCNVNSINIAGGTGWTITGNNFGGCTYCIDMTGNQTGVTIIGNTFGSNSVPGGGTGVAIWHGGGDGSHVNIIGNSCISASTCVYLNGAANVNNIGNS